MSLKHSLSGLSVSGFGTLNPGFALIPPPKRSMKSPPNPQIVYVPSKAPTPSKSDVNYRNIQNAPKSVLLRGECDRTMALMKETTDREQVLVNDPKDLLEGLCPEMGTLERKTTRDELLVNSKRN